MRSKLLQELGLSDKEITAYEYLLSNPRQTATKVAKHTGESRTNTYMLLEKLAREELVAIDHQTAVRTYSVANPLIFRHMLQQRERELYQTKQLLFATLPDIQTAYNLAEKKPGVMYLEGIMGLKSVFEDMAHSKTELLCWGSDIANADPKAWQIIEKGGYKRKAKGIPTRCLFHDEARHWPHIQEFAYKGFEVRLWGQRPFLGEVTIYDNKVVITNYQPHIGITVITNAVIADTYRVIFENCWHSARSL